MTPALRKRHQRIWWFLGFALLLIWGASMAASNKNKVPDTMLNEKSKESGFFVTLIKGNTYHTKKVSIDVYGTIPSPQTLVYLAPNEKTNISDSQLLGRLDGKGRYSFALDSAATAMPTKVIKGYDSIHKQELFSTIINNQ